jgi:hypothetical protein
MRIGVQYRFYLDYLMPRMDERLSGVLKFPDLEAYIQGWDRRSPLFPESVDQSLSGADLTMRSVDFPLVGISRKVKDYCVDRLDIALIMTSDSAPSAQVVKPTLEKAVRVANMVLGHLRVVARAPSLQLIGRYWKPGHSEFALLVPHTESWVNPDYGSQWPVFDGIFSSTFSSGAVRVPDTGFASAKALATSVQSDWDPPLPDSLLVDAESALMSLRIREAILCVASAVEISANEYRESQTVISKNQANLIVSSKKAFAERYFEVLTQATCGRSLRAENIVAFDQVNNAYQQRNSLIHGGKIREPLASADELDRYQEVLRWLSAARSTIEWLSTLPR